MTYAILEMQERQRLDALCQLGARPRIISAMMPNLSNTVIRAHWLKAQGKAPKQGGATSRPSAYWSTLRIRLHASFALCTYLQIELTQAHFINAYLVAYEEYRAKFLHDAPECFDWFWGLVQNYLDGEIALADCNVCNINYIHNPSDLVNDRNCPGHRLLMVTTEVARRKSAINCETVPAPMVDGAIIDPPEKSRKPLPNANRNTLN